MTFSNTLRVIVYRKKHARHFICEYTIVRLTIVRRANGTKTYGTLRDEGVITEVERVSVSG